MLTIKKAKPKDQPVLLKILRELDLFYPGQSPDDFWIAQKEEKIIGTVQFKEYNNFYFLSSLAVVPKERKHGIASGLLKELFRISDKNIYLYTVIPEFFEKFGFMITAPVPGLPSKNTYECESCQPEKCACMAKSFF